MSAATKLHQESTQPGTLEAALLAAQADVETIGKDAFNEHHKFKYTAAEAVIKYGRPILNRHGLTVRVRGYRYVDIGTEQIDGKDEGDPPLTVPIIAIEGSVRVTHAASGQSDEWTTQLIVTPGKGRPWDKASLAGETEILGYTIRDLLQLDRGDTEAVSGRDDSEYDPSKRRAQPKPERKPPQRAVQAPPSASLSPSEKASELASSRVRAGYQRLRNKFGEKGKTDEESGIGWKAQILPRFRSVAEHDFDPNDVSDCDRMVDVLADIEADLATKAALNGPGDEMTF